MDIRFYNTLRHEIETFRSVEPGKVLMYNCGPTVYDFAHIGNFRAFIFSDVLRRFLELAGYDVTQVMNITDVGHMTDDDVADGAGEDKMQVAIERLQEAKKSGKLPPGAMGDPNDPYQVAEYYLKAFLEDGRRLGLRIVDEYPERMPRATAYIESMLRLIGSLIERGHAYVGEDGAVYFSIESFPEYGRLSGNTLEQLRGGAGGRVDAAKAAAKRHPADFLLWKPDPAHVMKWDSPWGKGYPGWHIECSAMALGVLKRDTLDIHTGGEDNIFPHHECEIAQSSGATGKPFANFWMHTRFLLVEGQKMSKRKGNFYTVRDLIAKGFDPVVIRYELLKVHYRSNMNFTLKGLADSASAVQRLRDRRAHWAQAARGATADVDLSHPMLASFTAALADDLNTAGALGALFKWASETSEPAAEALAALDVADQVLNVLTLGADEQAPGADDLDPELLCKQLDAARAARQFDRSDAIRQQLQAMGYEVQSTKEGTVARRRLA